MTYHLLLTREGPDAPWAPQFGDRDVECVETERDDMVYTFRNDPERGSRKSDTKIIHFARVPTQRQVDERVAFLNGKEV